MQFYVLFSLVSLFFCAYGQVTDVGCGTNKTCYKWPTNCALNASDCRFISWRKSVTTDDFFFEMRSNVGAGKYHAFAFGENPRMQNADVYVCSTRIRSGSIADYSGPKLELSTIGFTPVSHSLTGGILECKFTRAKTVRRVIGDISKNFDLQGNSYHILMAVGDATANGLTKHSERYATAEKFNFSTVLTSTATTATATAIGSTVASIKPANATAARGTANQTTTTAASQTTTSGAVVTTDAGCGTRKACFRHPPNCKIASSSCRFISWNRTGDSYEFQISGSAGSGTEYVAIGFALTNKMEDVDLYICDGKTLTSAVIAQRHSAPINLQIATGITSAKVGTTNGVAQCIFQRPASVTKTTSTKNQIFNLNQERYHLLVAVGQTNGMRIQKHTWKMASNAKYDFTMQNSCKQNVLLSSWLLSGIVIFALSNGIW